MKTKTILIGAGLALSAAACAPPVRDLDAEEISALTDLEELMYVKATIADPRFALAKKLGDREPTEEEWAGFADMGARLQVTSKHGLRFSQGAGFDAYLKTLGGQAQELERAAHARDKAETVRLTLAIKDTCAGCHDDFR